MYRAIHESQVKRYYIRAPFAKSVAQSGAVDPPHGAASAKAVKRRRIPPEPRHEVRQAQYESRAPVMKNAKKVTGTFFAFLA
jgi:hypothetical protein